MTYLSAFSPATLASAQVTDVEFTADGSRIISKDIGGTAIVWNVSTGEQVSDGDGGTAAASTNGGRPAAGDGEVSRPRSLVASKESDDAPSGLRIADVATGKDVAFLDIGDGQDDFDATDKSAVVGFSSGGQGGLRKCTAYTNTHQAVQILGRTRMHKHTHTSSNST